MQSAIYEGYLRHRRFTPHAHRFSYAVFMMYLDLDELPEVMAKSPFWSERRWRPVRFQREDFLGPADMPLKEAVIERIREATGREHDGPVRMLANLRYWGFVMNPITCYYCFDRDENLRNIVVEVTNTPWNERQSYVLDCDPEQRFQRIQFQKQMHVSPFNPMDMIYRWCSNDPARVLSLNLETLRNGNSEMDATLALKRREIDNRNLNGILLRHPWMTAKVAGAIYWEALKLWIKRNPFYDHPKSSATDVVDSKPSLQD